MRTPTIPAGPTRWDLAAEDAVDHGRLAPSVHNTQPWTFVLFPDRIELRADRSRQLAVLDPDGRELLQSIGAALFNVRASLAASGLAVTVDRLPSPDDRDLVAVVRPARGAPDRDVAPLARAIRRRHTNRRPFEPATVPDEEVQELARAAALEDSLLIPVRAGVLLAAVAELTQEADRLTTARQDRYRLRSILEFSRFADHVHGYWNLSPASRPGARSNCS